MGSDVHQTNQSKLIQTVMEKLTAQNQTIVFATDFLTNFATDLIDRQASFAIEIAKFIENELFNNIGNIFQILNAFLLIYKFEIISCDELLEGLFIDSCYRTFDTFIENKDVSELEKGIYMNYEILKFMESRA